MKWQTLKSPKSNELINLTMKGVFIMNSYFPSAPEFMGNQRRKYGSTECRDHCSRSCKVHHRWLSGQDLSRHRYERGVGNRGNGLLSFERCRHFRVWVLKLGIWHEPRRILMSCLAIQKSSHRWEYITYWAILLDEYLVRTSAMLRLQFLD